MTTNDFEIKFIELKRNTAARRREVTKKYDAELKDARDKQMDIKRRRTALKSEYTIEKVRILESDMPKKSRHAAISKIHANLLSALDALNVVDNTLRTQIADLETHRSTELYAITQQHNDSAKALHEEYIQWLADRKEENKLSNRELKQACYNVYNYMRQRGKDAIVQHITETDAVEVKLVKLEPHEQTLQIS